MNRFIVSLLLAGLAAAPGYAQQDSVIIKGKVLNLSGRLYREAPGITFSRNNILAPSTELSVNAPLQADGSFRASLPLAASVEEIYLDYGGKVYTTFLAQKGEVEITFDADSMFKTARLFQFRGVNANANNFYPSFLAQEAKLLESNRSLGTDFQRTFWSQGFQSAKQTLLQWGNLRQSALTSLLSEGKQSGELTEWVNSLVEDERATLLMEYSMENYNELPPGDDADIKRFATTPLTYQKVLRASRFKGYAATVLETVGRVRLPADRRSSVSLPVDKIAGLILQYVSPLAALERDKLGLIIEKKNVDKEELDFLSGLYRRGGEKLATIAGFEKNVHPFRAIYEGPALDFLVAASLTDDFFKYQTDEKRTLYEHIKDNIYNATIRLSLDELYRMEVRDSVAVREVLTRSLTATPTEVRPGIWMAESTGNGRNWLDNVLKQQLGRPVYVINWDIYNGMNREELESVAALRSRLPGDVAFVFLHVSDPDRPQLAEVPLDSDERKMWKQYVIRHGLEGTHLFLDADQVVELGLRTPGIPGTFYIIRPDGRFHSRNAPSPLKTDDVVREIEKARQK